MMIKTGAGIFKTNKHSHFAKWAQGWTEAGGFTGSNTFWAAWDHAQLAKCQGVSWYALGKLMVFEQATGRSAANKSCAEALQA